MTPRIGNFAKRNSVFGPGLADAEAAQLESVKRCRQAHIQQQPDAAKNQCVMSYVYHA